MEVGTMKSRSLGIQGRHNRAHIASGRKLTLLAEPRPAVDDSVRLILSDESWYGDDEPGWSKAPTVEKADGEQRQATKRLRRYPYCDDFHGAKELADRLEKCRPSRRCMSGACPLCLRAFQRWLVASLQTLIGDGEE